ncbi:MAG: DUF1294 domain-containing protein [Gammaproteobacteria bacterium]|nr:DUF1294 domain-containing protein [Gammaproteobacteria bacterium]NNC98022.1 DUF1294 domain-containing protein [Gammaproteobacteria bacterium]NNM13762.1 DUF1294 domain-containing protein [Gammaproteobacteria bacterium]
MQGKVVKYNASKGYGFIRCDEFKDDIFVHIKNVNNARKLRSGQTVSFEVQETPKGLAAVSVKSSSVNKTIFTTFVVLSLLITAASFVGAYTYGKTGLLPVYLVVINVSTFLMYGYDKSVAGTHKARVPEDRLHLFALLGGSPAAFAAQKFFRHKTMKKSFKIMYWVIVIIQAGLFWIYWQEWDKVLILIQKLAN